MSFRQTSFKGEPKWDDIQDNNEYFENTGDPYEQPSAQQVAQQAQQFRQIYEEPQRNEITRRLEQAIADASSQEEKIRANYQNFYNAMRNREQEQSRMDLESAVARGGGRSGLVPFMGERRDQYYTGKLSGAEAQKMAELNAISNQLGLVQRQVPDELRSLAEQASRLEAQELQRLMDMHYERQREHELQEFARALNVYDRTHLTPLEQLQLYLQMADVAGKFPAKPPSVRGGS